MARGHKQPTERGPSQRALRVLCGAAGVVAATSTAALAEICDKAVSEDWVSAHGPVWLLNPVGFPFGLSFLIASLVLVAVLRSRMLALVLIALTASSIAVAVTVDLIPQHEIYLMQVSEGCRSLATDWMDVGVLSAFAAALFWLARRIDGTSAGRPAELHQAQGG